MQFLFFYFDSIRNKYIKLIIVAIVVAKFAVAAINLVLFSVIFDIISTRIIVNTVLNICSIDCDFAVAVKLCLPLKYPFNTDDTDTKNIDGARHINEYLASGICKAFSDIGFAYVNNSIVPVIPIIANVTNAILKILCAPLLSPTASLSDTKYEIALGTPVDENVSNNAYI